MALTATIFSHDTAERRSGDRRAIAAASTLRDEESRPYAVLVEDLSRDGLSMVAGITLAVDSTVSIGLPGVGRRDAVVVHAAENRYGCRFVQPLTPDMLAQAFAGDPVVEGRFAPLPTLDLSHEPQVERWHPALRIGGTIAAATLLWSGILLFF